jgi:hypothetical protein
MVRPTRVRAAVSVVVRPEVHGQGGIITLEMRLSQTHFHPRRHFPALSSGLGQMKDGDWPANHGNPHEWGTGKNRKI